jgi:hypothetical protein
MRLFRCNKTLYGEYIEGGGVFIYWLMDGYHESIVRFRLHLKVSVAGSRSSDYWMIDLEIITSDSTCRFLETFLEWTTRTAWIGCRS